MLRDTAASKVTAAHLSRQALLHIRQLFPVTEDEDVAVTQDEDVRGKPWPRRLVLAGPGCAWWRGGGQSVVISVMAGRALGSSTMDLRSAHSGTRGWGAMVVSAPGRPRAGAGVGGSGASPQS